MTRADALFIIRLLNDEHIKGKRWDEQQMLSYARAAKVIREGASV